MVVDADGQIGTVEHRGEAPPDLGVAKRQSKCARPRVLDTGWLHGNMDKDLMAAIARSRHLRFKIARIRKEGQRQRSRQRHRAI